MYKADPFLFLRERERERAREHPKAHQHSTKACTQLKTYPQLYYRCKPLSSLTRVVSSAKQCESQSKIYISLPPRHSKTRWQTCVLFLCLHQPFNQPCVLSPSCHKRKQQKNINVCSACANTCVVGQKSFSIFWSKLRKSGNKI